MPTPSCKPEVINPLPGLEGALAPLGIHPLGYGWPGSVNESSSFIQFSIVRGDDGALRWEQGPRAGCAAAPAGRIEHQLVFEKLYDGSQLSAALLDLDGRLTDATRRDLWQWTAVGWQPFAAGVAGALKGKKILLFIHGTFSHCDKIFLDLEVTAHGPAFLAKALQRYDLVLGFNHPTLSVSPVVNAFALAALMRDSAGVPASVDVICHSRGGLVARWWLEGFAVPGTVFRAVFVASPLGGTNLAAPPRIKSAFDLLTNIASIVGTGPGMAGEPIIQFVGGMIRILSSFVQMTVQSPALDAAVAVVPGLAAQSRGANNMELRGLRSAGTRGDHQYFAVSAEFRPPTSDVWKFWKVFCDPSHHALAGADQAVDLVFAERRREGGELEASPNDLVVDCSSMTELADSGTANDFAGRLDFGESSEVMHTNYFQFRKTLDFIAVAFGW